MRQSSRSARDLSECHKTAPNRWGCGYEHLQRSTFIDFRAHVLRGDGGDVRSRGLRVKPQFWEEVTWQLGDARDAGLVGALGLQDIMVANWFLCHMHPEEAEECLRNLARLVKPGGYFFVSGVDLSVRSKVARDLGGRPVSHGL